MKLLVKGDKERAVCERDGVATVTYDYRDVPFSDGKGRAKGILVGVCDKCGEVVSIPPQSIPSIKAAREGAPKAVEARLPSVYLDAIDLACHRINATASTEFRKSLLMVYVSKFSENKKKAKRLVYDPKKFGKEFVLGEKLGEQRRLSMKISAPMFDRIARLERWTNLNRTDLFKCLAAEINKDIVRPVSPAHLEGLKMMALVATS
jgi:hypothetical protein